jgi:hypothetical protein
MQHFFLKNNRCFWLNSFAKEKIVKENFMKILLKRFDFNHLKTLGTANKGS